ERPDPPGGRGRDGGNRGPDPRMGERGPDEGPVTGADGADGVGIDGAGQEEARILRPQDPGTENAHARSAPSAARIRPPRPSAPASGDTSRRTDSISARASRLSGT